MWQSVNCLFLDMPLLVLCSRFSASMVVWPLALEFALNSAGSHLCIWSPDSLTYGRQLLQNFSPAASCYYQLNLIRFDVTSFLSLAKQILNYGSLFPQKHPHRPHVRSSKVLLLISKGWNTQIGEVKVRTITKEYKHTSNIHTNVDTQRAIMTTISTLYS